MKKTFLLFAIALLSINVYAQNNTDPLALRQSLDKATAAVRDAYSKGDAARGGAIAQSERCQILRRK